MMISRCVMCSLIMLSITNSLGTKNVLSIKNPSQTAASCETLVSISDECSNIFEANEQGHCECLKVGYDCNEIERISIFSTKPHGARAFQVYENRFCENKTNEFGEFNLLQVKNERQTIEACADAVFSHGILCSALFHLHDGKCECVKPGRTCNHKQATNAAVYQITNLPTLSHMMVVTSVYYLTLFILAVVMSILELYTPSERLCGLRNDYVIYANCLILVSLSIGAFASGFTATPFFTLIVMTFMLWKMKHDCCCWRRRSEEMPLLRLERASYNHPSWFAPHYGPLRIQEDFWISAGRKV